MEDTFRVLYVDDEPGLLGFAKLYLEREGTFVVDTLTSARAALEKLKKERYDAIVSDYQMPEIDGIGFLKQLKASGNTTPFIIFTGKGREEVVVEALNEGADFYLQKGGDPKSQFAELTHKIRSAVNRKKTENALRESELFLKETQQIARLGGWKANFHTDYLEWTDGIYDIIEAPRNYRPGLMEGMKYYAPEDIPVIQEKVATCLSTGQPFAIEVRIITDTGKQVWAEVRGLAPVIEGGRSYVMGTLQDISERRKTEEALQRSEEKHRILNRIISTVNKADDLSQLLTSILDESLHLLDFDAGGIYLGNSSTRTAELVHSKNILREILAEIQTIPMDEAPYDTLFIQNTPIFTDNYVLIAPGRSKRSGFQSMASIPLISKDMVIGALNIASTRRYAISDEEKQMLTSIGRELGSALGRMLAEEELKKASKNLETLFNSIDEMVFVLDMQGDILAVNDTVSKRLLFTPAELTGTNVLLLHVPERRDEAFQIVQGMIAGTIESCPVPVLSKDGTRIEVETKVTRGWWNNREVLIGVTRDITGRRQAEEALLRSEEKHRILIENSHDIIYTITREGILTFVSPSWTTHLGHPVKEVVGKSFQDFVHPDDIASCWVFIQSMINTGQRQAGVEYRVKHIDGSWRWHTTNAVPLRDNDGTIIGGEGSASDITIRKQAEQALKESEEKFRGIFDTINDGVQIHEIEPDGKPGKFIELNNVACQMLQYTREELRDLGPLDIVTGYHSRPLNEIIAELSSEGHSIFETEHRRKDGTIIPVEVHSQVVILQGKRVMVGVVRDITERKRAEEAIRESVEKFREIFDSANDGFHLHEVHENGLPGNYVDVNEAVCRMLQYSKEELLQKNPLELSTEFHNPPLEQVGQELKEKGHVVFETGHRRKDGTIIPVEINAHIITIQGKKLTLAIARDITDRRRAEKVLRQANRKLNLLSGITRHDINNQLTVLQGYLGILEEKQTDPSLTGYFHNVTTAAQHISAMIQFTKTYESIGVNDPIWQDCRALLNTAAGEAPIGKVTVKNDLPAGAELFADPLIVKVFYNLMDNAARYGGKITTIRFSVEESGEAHVIVCEDDGDGVPADEKEKIFIRGFGKNTGLGLFLSREILDITGITITETGTPGKGARFEIRVPKGMYRNYSR